jgi:hypothetical protein
MGTVHRALDLDSGRQVAVKVLHRSADAQRFAREARLLEDVHHAAVVRYVTQGTSADDEPYLVMEWLEGEELGARLSRGPLTIADTLLLARRLAGALAEIHARGVVHRDLKPSNLYLPGCRVEDVKLLDFSIALPREGSEQLTRTGIAIGTPGYMAPEQARGERDVDGRADLFSLGCVLFQCATGRPAFVANQVIALLTKVLLEEAPRVSSLRPDVPEALADLIDRLMCKRPEGRPAGAVQVLAELDRIDAAVSRSISETVTVSARLAAGEQRLISVLLVGAGGPRLSDRPPRPFAPTLTVATSEAQVGAGLLAGVARAHGATLDHLADGSSVMTLHGAGVPTDRAALAARCALALRAALGEVPVVLATGRGLAGERAPVGEVIDRAARLFQGVRGDLAGAPGIRVDELSAGLLGDRFEIIADGDRLLLREERGALSDDARLLLGRATSCVGRERELRMLEEVFEVCVSEPSARALLVIGEAGVGKSRLRRELMLRLAARAEPVEVWIARGDPLSTGSPFGLLGQLLRRAAGVLDGEPIEDRRAKLRARVAPYLDAERAELAEFLGELSGTPFPDEESAPLRAARHDPLVMGDRMLRAFVEFIDAECQRRPVVVLLEDLHWADLPTVQYLDAALRGARERPFFVLALARPDVATQFPGLWAKRPLETIKLGALTRRACAELAREVLGDRADAEAHHAVGDGVAARGAIAQAQRRLRSRAEKIADAALRESFLARVPENARTLALDLTDNPEPG